MTDACSGRVARPLAARGDACRPAPLLGGMPLGAPARRRAGAAVARADPRSWARRSRARRRPVCVSNAPALRVSLRLDLPGALAPRGGVAVVDRRQRRDVLRRGAKAERALRGLVAPDDDRQSRRLHRRRSSHLLSRLRARQHSGLWLDRRDRSPVVETRRRRLHGLHDSRRGAACCSPSRCSRQASRMAACGSMTSLPRCPASPWRDGGARAHHRRLRHEDGPRAAQRLDAADLCGGAYSRSGRAERRGGEGGRDRPHPFSAASALRCKAGARRWSASASVSAFYGVAIGITQQNPKTVLAYSSISQMGVIAAALGMALAAATPARRPQVAFYAANHVLVKGALFLAVGVAAATDFRRDRLVSDPGGRARAEPRRTAVHRRRAGQARGQGPARRRRCGKPRQCFGRGKRAADAAFPDASCGGRPLETKRPRRRPRSSGFGPRSRSARFSSPGSSIPPSAIFWIP